MPEKSVREDVVAQKHGDGNQEVHDEGKHERCNAR